MLFIHYGDYRFDSRKYGCAINMPDPFYLPDSSESDKDTFWARRYEKGDEKDSDGPWFIFEFDLYNSDTFVVETEEDLQSLLPFIRIDLTDPNESLKDIFINYDKLSEDGYDSIYVKASDKSIGKRLHWDNDLLLVLDPRAMDWYEIVVSSQFIKVKDLIIKLKDMPKDAYLYCNDSSHPIVDLYSSEDESTVTLTTEDD